MEGDSNVTHIAEVTHIVTSDLHTHGRMHTHAHVHTYLYIQTHIYTYTHTDTGINTHIYIDRKKEQPPPKPRTTARPQNAFEELSSYISVFFH